MKKAILIFTSALIALSVQSQQLVNAEFLGNRTKTEILGRTFYAVDYAVDVYKVTYESKDAKGQLDTLSGLVALPELENVRLPIFINQHGTTDGKFEVPSTEGDEDFLGLVSGGFGYISIQPDYVGMGEGRGFHPYLHAETEAQAAIDLLIAVESWLPGLVNGIQTNGQLFVTGYSQGGHSSMALHRTLEQDFSGEYTVTAAAHLSGPYSMSGVVIDQALVEQPYTQIAYLPYTVIGLNEVYGNIFTDLSQVFKEPYLAEIQAFYNNYDNGASLFGLNNTLINLLIQNEGSPILNRILQDDIVTALRNKNPANPLIQALLDNDVYDWAPEAKTFIYYCQADEQVNFRNAIVADSVMRENGATDVTLLNLNSNANHGQCALLAYDRVLDDFNALAMITTDTRQPQTLPLHIYPNPTKDEFYVQMPSTVNDATIEVYDLYGKRIMTVQDATGRSVVPINVQALASGMYVVQIRTQEVSYLNKISVY